MTEPRMDPSDLANRLMDVERAGAQRCDTSATLLQQGNPLQAQLLLQAAEHRAAAEVLNDAVVRLLGTPQSGEADIVLRDPAGPGFPIEAPDDSGLLASCIDEAEGAVDSYRQALQADALPDWLQDLLARRLASVQDQLERLLQARQAAMAAPLTN